MRGVALASGEIVEGNAVVIAMGPWSILAARWLSLPAVFGYKGHSLVFETGETIPAEALQCRRDVPGQRFDTLVRTLVRCNVGRIDGHRPDG